MLPPELSTDLTSLNQDEDRAAMVVDMTIGDDGAVVRVGRLPRADPEQSATDLQRDRRMARWIGPAPAAFSRVPGLADQFRLQDAIAARLRDRRETRGARVRAIRTAPVVEGDGVKELRTETTNRAKSIIENFMVAANGVTARFLTERGFATIRASSSLPTLEPHRRTGGAARGIAPRRSRRARAAAVPQGEARRRARHVPGFVLAIIKLLGRGEYVAESAAEPSGHFALATGPTRTRRRPTGVSLMSSSSGCSRRRSTKTPHALSTRRN